MAVVDDMEWEAERSVGMCHSASSVDGWSQKKRVWSSRVCRVERGIYSSAVYGVLSPLQPEALLRQCTDGPAARRCLWL